MMELFRGARFVKLRSHLDKFLVADDDGETIRQSRNSSSRKAVWAVEPSALGSGRFVRLRNYNGRYLTASETPFLLGATGKKVTQSELTTKWDPRVDWEPVRDGFQLKLRTTAVDGGRKFLRANGGAPPWRNSVTHDSPHAAASQRSVLWDVEVVDETADVYAADSLSSMSSFSSLEESAFGSEPPSPMSVASAKASPKLTFSQNGGMDLFRNAKAVRLRSHHEKYLTAEEDESSVTQDRNGSSKSARWTVEFVGGGAGFLRLRSCYGKYLTASNQPFLLGMTGCKVTQTLPRRPDSSVEWQPIKEGSAAGTVKLRTRYGNFLRGNGGLPPWRNSVTHDQPHRTATQDWILWDVEIIEILQSQSPNRHPPARSQQPVSPNRARPQPISPPKSSSYSRQESIDSEVGSPPKMEGRTIYYSIADDSGHVGDGDEEASFSFKGNGVEDLTHKLEEETGLKDIIVCSRSPLNGKLYPLRLQLPPNNSIMRVVVVQSSSRVARDFAK